MQPPRLITITKFVSHAYDSSSSTSTTHLRTTHLLVLVLLVLVLVIRSFNSLTDGVLTVGELRTV